MPKIRRHFLFVAWDGGGNVVPMLLIVKKLLIAGHTVTLLGNESLRQRTQEAGAAFLPYSEYGSHDPKSPETDLVRPWEGRGPSAVAELVRERILFGPALSIAKDVLDAADRIQPNVIGVDYVMFGGFLGAEAARRPWVILIPHGYPLPHAGCRGRGPFTYLFQRMIAAGLTPLNEARQALKLSPLDSTMEQYTRATRILLTTYKFFDKPGPEVPQQAVYVGSQLDLPEHASEGPRNGSLPLVLVSLSTAYQAQESLLARIVHALSSLPVHAMVLTGEASDKQGVQSRDNIEVKSFVPHASVLPRTSLVITHAGHGTLMGALEHGVPLLCLPCTQDQFDNAHRAAELGAGLELPGHSTVDVLREAVQKLLNTRGYLESARQLRECILAEHNPLAAVQELECCS
jgi:MGT family glycosyltransferase